MSIIHKLVFVLSRNGRVDSGYREYIARLAATAAVTVPTYLIDAHFGWPILQSIGLGLERLTSQDFASEKRIALPVIFLAFFFLLSLLTQGSGSKSSGKLKEYLLFVAWGFATLMGAPLGVIYLGPPLLIAGASIAVTVGYTLLAYHLVPEEERP